MEWNEICCMSCQFKNDLYTPWIFVIIFIFSLCDASLVYSEHVNTESDAQLDSRFLSFCPCIVFWVVFDDWTCVGSVLLCFNVKHNFFLLKQLVVCCRSVLLNCLDVFIVGWTYMSFGVFRQLWSIGSC